MTLPVLRSTGMRAGDPAHRRVFTADVGKSILHSQRIKDSIGDKLLCPRAGNSSQNRASVSLPASLYSKLVPLSNSTPVSAALAATSASE
jgi:hypothetical protein